MTEEHIPDHPTQLLFSLASRSTSWSRCGSSSVCLGPEILSWSGLTFPSFLPKTTGNLQFFTLFSEQNKHMQEAILGFIALFKGISVLFGKWSVTLQLVHPPLWLVWVGTEPSTLLSRGRADQEIPTGWNYCIVRQSGPLFSVSTAPVMLFIHFSSTNDPVAEDNQIIMWAVSYFLLNCTN